MDGHQERALSGSGAPFLRIPLGGRGPTVYATIDAADAALVTPFRWHLDNSGYAIRTVDRVAGTKEAMARRIMGLRPGDGLETDHISRDKLDNRRSNLRVATHAQNAQNRSRSDGGCAARGVSLRKDKKSKPYQAYGTLAGKQTHLGFYATEDEAAEAARAWRAEHLPFATG